MNLTPETKAQIERMRALFTCAHEGKSHLAAIPGATVTDLMRAGLISMTLARYKLTPKGYELVLRALSEAP